MKKVLVVQYSQTGQLTDIVTSILEPLVSAKAARITTLTIKPQPEYPFPWSTQSFCDVFPESVEGVPCRLEPIALDAEARFDLIILAYQVWFLSPSLPVTAFLKNPAGQALLKDRPVVTLIACRNMWLQAQEVVIPLYDNPAAARAQQMDASHRKAAPAVMLTLPFFDDFSDSGSGWPSAVLRAA